METLKIKLRKARRDRELSQKYLAEKAGVNINTVQRAEYNGNISVNSLIKIAGALEIPPAYFFE